jgi:hypothetical protein
MHAGKGRKTYPNSGIVTLNRYNVRPAFFDHEGIPAGRRRSTILIKVKYLVIYINVARIVLVIASRRVGVSAVDPGWIFV